MRRLLIAVAVTALLSGGLWLRARIEDMCPPASATATQVRSAPTGLSIQGRTYLFRAGASADYGAHMFPVNVGRGHPVAVSVDVTTADGGPISELRATCIRVRHANEVIERPVHVASRTDTPPGGNMRHYFIAAATGSIPEWPPGETLNITLRLVVGDIEYEVDVGETVVTGTV